MGDVTRLTIPSVKLNGPKFITEQSPIGPGWYRTRVAGEERWWDGAAWTLHARPGPGPGPAQVAAPDRPVANRAPNSFWRGSKEGSLIVSIFCALLTIPTGLYMLWALLSGSLAFLILFFALLLFVFLAVFLLLNFFGLRRQEAAARALHASPAQPPPTA